MNEEIGPDRDQIKKSGFQLYLEDFLKGIDNIFIVSTLYRMLETGKFIKHGEEIYTLTDDEKQRLTELKPVLDNLIKNVSEIKDVIEKESDKEINKMYSDWSKKIR